MAAPLSSASAGPAYTCPDKIQLPAGAPAGQDLAANWMLIVSSGPVRLSGVSVFDGPPQEGAALKPGSVAQSGATITWKFSGTFAQGKWLACDYGGGVARAVMRAPDDSTFCVAHMERRTGPSSFKARFECS